MNTRDNMLDEIVEFSNGHTAYLMKGVSLEAFLTFGESQDEVILGVREDNGALYFDTYEKGSPLFGAEVLKAFPDALIFAAEQWDSTELTVYSNSDKPDAELYTIAVDEDETWLEDSVVRLGIQVRECETGAVLEVFDFIDLTNALVFDENGEVKNYPSSRLEEYCPELTSKRIKLIEEYVLDKEHDMELD